MLFDEFEVIVSDCEETVTSQDPEKVTYPWSMIDKITPRPDEKVAGSLSLRKDPVIVIGADTVVSIDGKILGKPADQQQAVDMLHMLSGKCHNVSTGVALVGLNDGRQTRFKSFSETTEVMVAELTEEEINSYVNTSEPYDKAGAYGIQGMFGKHIQGIGGDYNNVVGLPVHRLYQALKDFLN
jgi:septum formation protein